MKIETNLNERSRNGKGNSKRKHKTKQIKLF